MKGPGIPRLADGMLTMCVQAFHHSTETVQVLGGVGSRERVLGGARHLLNPTH